MKPGRRSVLAIAAALLAALPMVFGGRLDAVVAGLSASVTSAGRGSESQTYPAFTGTGEPDGTATWRVIGGLGDCCENYFGVTASGRLLNLGGDSIMYSDDRGITWMRVSPSAVGLIGAEGGVVSAPNGDILGATWDPYSGDRVVTYKYVKAEDKWYYADGQLHTPFADRPWISLIPGPITVGAVTLPYITVFGGGLAKMEVHYYSLDGLNYTLPDLALGDALANVDTSRWLDLPEDPATDALQPHTHSWLAPLPGGGALLYGLPVRGCGWRILDATGRWSCFSFPDGSKPNYEGRLLVDSLGRIHEMNLDDATRFIYRMSSDGGRTWSQIALTMPDGAIIDDFDFKASGLAKVTALAVHGQRPFAGSDADYVFKISTAGATPVVDRIFQVGNADYDFGSYFSVGGRARFDFTSIAIFPDGKIATSFADASHTVPAVAIEP